MFWCDSRRAPLCSCASTPRVTANDAALVWCQSGGRLGHYDELSLRAVEVRGASTTPGWLVRNGVVQPLGHTLGTVVTADAGTAGIDATVTLHLNVVANEPAAMPVFVASVQKYTVLCTVRIVRDGYVRCPRCC